MKEAEIRNYFINSQEKDLDKVITVGQNVARGLTLEKGTPPDYLMERFQIVGVITNTLIETCEILNIDIPKVDKIYEWEDIDKEKLYSGFVATAGPEEIKFSPAYLKRLAIGFNRSGPGANDEINSLVNTTAHEGYHVWQWDEFPERSLLDFEQDRKWMVYALQSLDFSLNDIPKSASEREALSFGKQIENIHKDLRKRTR